ncbi:putative efflux pump membrane fusion protein [Pannonibacter phragmitetus]|uniref:Putative efflux pump membrane fusion protein n=2 Tax=Pannonibacter phragmitetus TaxID=121719 RepID=A0A378ZVC7_9HYPH|nr:putative efflux pump membrane fusion protein [Pannonibacter phragmitetus]
MPASTCPFPPARSRSVCDPQRLICMAAVIAALLLPAGAGAADLAVQPLEVTDWKAVYATVEPAVRVPVRARTQGTVTELAVKEGDALQAGQRIGRIVDEKLALRRQALSAQIAAAQSEAANLETEAGRARQLLARGTISQARVDQLETQLEVARNSLRAAEAGRDVLDQQEREGEILAAASGRVLSVPVALGALVMPGETIAEIAREGFILRLELPERHAGLMKAGDTLHLPQEAGAARRSGEITLVYPELRGGRVIADASAPDMGDFFVGERIPVEIATGTRSVLAVPEAALTTRYGLDYVQLRRKDGSAAAITVQRGQVFETQDGPQVEVLSGLAAGDVVVLP